MNSIAGILYGMAPYVHLIAFGLLVLSGLNFPVSEDLVIIISASIAATVIPQNCIIIFIGCFLGAFLSDSLAYTVGRIGGRRLLESSLVRRLFHADRILTVENYFIKYGGKTLFFGRFVPFGVRNVLFMTSGFVRMKYIKFFIIDLCAVSITSTILFSIGYTLGGNYSRVMPYLDRYKMIIFTLFILILLTVYTVRKFKNRKNGTAV